MQHDLALVDLVSAELVAGCGLFRCPVLIEELVMPLGKGQSAMLPEDIAETNVQFGPW